MRTQPEECAAGRVGCDASLRRRMYRAAGLLATALAATVLGWPAAPAAPDPLVVYFYNPETSVKNFASLKIEFDTYLSGHGPYQFQPFSDRSTFEESLSLRQNGVFLVSSWHFRQLRHAADLDPALVGVYRGKTTQRKLLAVRKDLRTPGALTGGTVATAGTEEYTVTVLREMMGRENLRMINSLKVLTVPKEIDALMSVGFGMAGSALTTESTMTKLSLVNSKLHAMLYQMAVSEESLLPVVAVPGKDQARVQPLVAILEGMSARPEGQARLHLLGLEGLRRIGPAEMRYLKE